jgi:hypothetical protein
MGSTYLTLFPSRNGTSTNSNPCNTEFAIHVATPSDVDAIYDRLLRLGARTCMIPEDTWMYEPMRFACVDDPFGVSRHLLSSTQGKIKKKTKKTPKKDFLSGCVRMPLFLDFQSLLHALVFQQFNYLLKGRVFCYLFLLCC